LVERSQVGTLMQEGGQVKWPCMNYIQLPNSGFVCALWFSPIHLRCDLVYCLCYILEISLVIIGTSTV